MIDSLPMPCAPRISPASLESTPAVGHDVASDHARYLGDLAVWLGWIVFYGSFALGGVFAAAALSLGPVIVPREERGLEARFGDAYREFRRTTPRWLGKTRR